MLFTFLRYKETSRVQLRFCFEPSRDLEFSLTRADLSGRIEM